MYRNYPSKSNRTQESPVRHSPRVLVRTRFCGQPTEIFLDRNALALLERARRAGYLLVTRSCRSPVGLAWWGWCEATNHPYVAVRTRQRHAELVFDLFTTDRDLTREIQEAVCDVFRLVGKRDRWGCGRIYACCDITRRVGGPLARYLLALVLGRGWWIEYRIRAILTEARVAL